MRLTDRQKELLQEDKYALVDSIIILEHKLEKAVKEIQFIKNEMLLISESIDNKVKNKAMQDIEKQLDEAWEGNITSENFVDTVSKIFTGEYYDKDKK
mgnify:FL=1